VQEFRAVAATLSGACLIAFAPILVRVSEVGPQATAFWRVAIGAAVLAALARGRGEPAPPRETRGLLLVAGLAFALDLACWHAAIRLTTVANATLLANLTPIVAGVAGWLLLKERLSLAWAAGAAGGLGGAALLALSRAGAGGEGGALGDGLALATTLFYAAYLLCVRRVRDRVSALAVMAWSSAAAAAACLPIALLSGEALWPATPLGWLWLLTLGAVVHVGGQGGIAYGLGRLPVAVTSVLILIQPVLSAGLGWALFGEAIGPLGFLGASLLLTGVWLAQRR